MPKFCQRCGAQNQDWAQACQNCAIPLPAPPTGNPQGYYPNYPPPPPQGQPYGAYPQMYGYAAQPAHAHALPGDYAGIGKRFLASLLEGVVVMAGCIPGFVLLMIGVGIADSAYSRSDREMGSLLAILGVILIIVGYLGMLLYNIYLLGRDGATLPKKWCGIAVLDRQGRPLGFAKALARELIKNVLGNACGLLLLWPLWDSEHQGLYDKMFDANVYEYDSNRASLNLR